jgi:hypothetical protein
MLQQEKTELCEVLLYQAARKSRSCRVYLITVATMKKKQHDALFKELINGHRHRSVGYNIRIGDEKNKGHSFYVCLNSFMDIMSLGKP